MYEEAKYSLDEAFRRKYSVISLISWLFMFQLNGLKIILRNIQ